MSESPLIVERKVAERKTFTFSNEEAFQHVNEMLDQKPEGLSNSDFLYKALKYYVEQDQLQETFNKLPPSVTTSFKGDLQKLETSFQMIKDVFQLHFYHAQEIISQHEAKLVTTHQLTVDELNQANQNLKTQIEWAENQNQKLKCELEELTKLKEESTLAQQTIQMQSQALSTLQSQLEEAKMQRHYLEEQLEGHVYQATLALQKELQTKNEEYRYLKRDYEIIQMNFDDFKANSDGQRSELQLQMEALKHTNSHLQNQLQVTQAQLTDAHQQIHTVLAKLAPLN